MLKELGQKTAYRVLQPLVSALVRLHVSPNAITTAGLVMNVAAAVVFVVGAEKGVRGDMTFIGWGGLVILVAGLFDMLDGQVARLSGRVTRFGGFLDSSLDRLSDMVVFVGLMVFYARDTASHSTLNVFLAGAGLMGSVMVSYASARAESLIPRCTVGLLERPERIVLLILGGLLNRMVGALWIIAVLSNVTAVQRVVYTYVELKKGWTRSGDDRAPD